MESNRFFEVAFFIVPLFMVFDLLWSKRRELALTREIYLRSRIKDWGKAFFLLTGVIITAVFFIVIAPESIKHGWLYYITKSDQAITGKIFTGTSENQNNSEMLKWGYLILVWGVFVVVMPFIARAEEKIFRANRLKVKEAVCYSILFGFSHLIVSVPPVVCLSLTGFGFALAQHYISVYKKQIKNAGFQEKAAEAALLETTRIHTLYNAMVVTIISCLVGLQFLLLNA